MGDQLQQCAEENRPERETVNDNNRGENSRSAKCC